MPEAEVEDQEGLESPGSTGEDFLEEMELLDLEPGMWAGMGS